jgi:flagellar biosynthetic protein FliR
MSLEPLLKFVPIFVLVFFRLAGMMLAAPLLGSSRVPRRLKVMFALVLALGIVPTVQLEARLPDSAWQIAIGIAGELLFGLALGTALTFVFVAVNWAGDIIGQQMGLGIGQVFDPQYGQAGSVVSDLYFLMTLVIFMIVGGHRTFLMGVRDSFDSLPLLSVSMNRDLLDLVIGLLTAATSLALQLAAPMLVTMLVSDVVLGFLSKTVPQINVMTAGLPLRSLAGMAVLCLGLVLSSRVIREAMLDAVAEIGRALAGPLST